MKTKHGGTRPGAGCKKGGKRTIGWQTQKKRLFGLKLTESEYDLIIDHIGDTPPYRWLKKTIFFLVGLDKNG